MATDVLEKLPVHNLDSERDLAIMDKIASRAAACPNWKFKAKGMKDDMTLSSKDKENTVDQETKNISNILDIHEKKWFESQAEITKTKIAARHEKAIHRGNYVHTLLVKCKQHGGPFTSKNELEICIQNNKESDIQLKRILRVEISNRKHTSLKDFQTSPELYKINQLSHMRNESKSCNFINR